MSTSGVRVELRLIDNMSDPLDRALFVLRIAKLKVQTKLFMHRYRVRIGEIE